MSETKNLLADVPRELPRELLQTVLTAESFRIERIVSLGHSSPPGFWYDQIQHEWVLLLQGAARLCFAGGKPIDLTPGSYVNIPAHQRHRVEWTDPDQTTIWLAIHYD